MALASSSLLAGISAAGAGGPVVVNRLTIVKTVSGPVSADTTFTVSIDCNNDVIDDGDGGTDNATVEFDADGQPTTPDEIDLLFDEYGSCTVSETADGGAESTTYACEGVATAAPAGIDEAAVVPICPAPGPQADPITVNKSYPAIDATVTVHNTFADPVTPPVIPASQVVAQPAFTG